MTEYELLNAAQGQTNILMAILINAFSLFTTRAGASKRSRYRENS